MIGNWHSNQDKTSDRHCMRSEDGAGEECVHDAM